MTGTGSVARGLELFSARQGGRAIAEFSGAPASFSVTEFPGQSDGSRAKVVTGGARGGFAFEGFVDARQLRFVTTQKLTLIDGHVWLNAGSPVRVVAARQAALRVSPAEAGYLPRQYAVWVRCSSLGLGAPKPRSQARPRLAEARAYLTRHQQVELYDAPRGRSILTLDARAAAGGILFWSHQTEADFVRVALDEDIAVDAWVRSSVLAPEPEGELVDRLAAPRTEQQPPALRVQGEPRIFKAMQSVPLKLSASTEAPVIGKILPDTEVYVLSVVAGWAAVLPKTLDVLAPGGGQFWIDASALGSI